MKEKYIILQYKYYVQPLVLFICRSVNMKTEGCGGDCLVNKLVERAQCLASITCSPACPFTASWWLGDIRRLDRTGFRAN